MSELQNKILELMKSQSEYEKCGHTYMGFRQISDILNVKQISVSNSMRRMFINGIFTDQYCKDQYADRFYRLDNNEFELKFCEKCIQMTNHLKGICKKCK